MLRALSSRSLQQCSAFSNASYACIWRSSSSSSTASSSSKPPTRAVMRRTRANESELASLCSIESYKNSNGGPWRLCSEPTADTETSASFHESDRELIEATFRFDNFSQAWSFMSRVALLCEKLNHHPEWSNTWNEVKISLTTHDHGNVVSQLDVHMAKQIDRIASEFMTSQDEED